MEQSLRDDIALLTCIFCFFLLLVPLTILNSYPERIYNESSIINHRNSTNLEWRKKLFIDSVEILDELSEKDDSDSLGFSYLMNMSHEDFNRSETKISVEEFEKRMKSVWSKFDLKNGTFLRSNSLKLPLKVDW